MEEEAAGRHARHQGPEVVFIMDSSTEEEEEEEDDDDEPIVLLSDSQEPQGDHLKEEPGHTEQHAAASDAPAQPPDTPDEEADGQEGDQSQPYGFRVRQPRTQLYTEMMQAKRTRRRKAELSPEGNAGEAGDDEEQQQQKGKRGKKPGNPKDLVVDEVEEAVAREVGLNETQPEEEEAAMLPSSAKEDAYVKVRNHVLARWRADIHSYLTLEEAGAAIRKMHQPLVDIAWSFLNDHGYINWGVAPRLLKDPPLTTPSGAAPDKPSIVVVGAGLAGAAAARHLTKMGYRVVVLEGRNRPGGRVWSMPLGGSECAGVGDLGGAIITGIDGNPLAVLAQQVAAQHNALLDAAHEFRESLPAQVVNSCSIGSALSMLWAEVPREAGMEEMQERLMSWHFANVEFANAAKLSTLSLGSWDQDDPYEMMGPHVVIPGGNAQLVEALLQDVPVFYNAVVTQIEYGDSGVTVTTCDTSFNADAVLVTVPLGVLKRDVITFSPPLPEAKQQVIKRLGFGVLNKLVMLFPDAFWGRDLDLMAHVAADPAQAGMFYLFYAYQPQLAGKGAVLAALVSGASAERFESIPVEQSVARVMTILRNMYEPQGVTVPDPVQAVATRWAADPMSYGSYSSVAVGAAGEDYDVMAQEVAGRLFFAGEATIRKWPATMHGAFLSGLREAAKIKERFEGSKKRRKRASRAVRAGSDDAEAFNDESESESDSDGDSTDSGEGYPGRSQRGQAGRAARKELRAQRAVTLPAAQTVCSLVRHGITLQRLFREVVPDIEFGSFSGLYGPADTPWADKVLLRVDLRTHAKGTAQKTIPLHVVLSREQVSFVRNAWRDEEARLVELVVSLGVQLVGRPGLDKEVVDMMSGIIAARNLDHLQKLPLSDELVPRGSARLTRAAAAAAAGSNGVLGGGGAEPGSQDHAGSSQGDGAGIMGGSSQEDGAGQEEQELDKKEDQVPMADGVGRGGGGIGDGEGNGNMMDHDGQPDKGMDED